MSLELLRDKIDNIDNQLLKLFIERMSISSEIAQYKKDNNLPVFQSGREDEIKNKINKSTPDNFKNSAQVLFENIMDISKCRQQQDLYKELPAINALHYPPVGKISIGCQGTEGAYSDIAAKKLFKNNPIAYYSTFEDVFKSVDNDEIDFGILPIMNSKAGSVSQTYELLRKYNLYIASCVSVKVSHCVAAKAETDINNIKKVYSHEQALAQCSKYLKNNELTPVQFANTALAAEYVKSCSEDIAAICSKECANSLGLKIIDDNIADELENYTKFICISKKIYISDGANIISVSLSLPHHTSALYRLLTKFSVIGLNLLRIESNPVGSKDFDVVFYLDFEGSINQPEVLQIINALKSELNYFKFLGNYSEVK